MTAFGIVALVLSAAAATLSVVAIVLSLIYFRMLTQLAQGLRESARELGSAAQRLERLCEPLHSDIEAALKDLRQERRTGAETAPSAGPENAASADLERRMDQRLDALRRELVGEISGMLARQKQGQPGQHGPPAMVDEVGPQSVLAEIGEVIDRAIAQSRQPAERANAQLGVEL